MILLLQVSNHIYILFSFFKILIQAPAEWRHYFLVLSGFNIWAAIIFYFCGSGQPETWTNVEKKPIQYESVEMKRNTSITNSKT